MMDRHPGGEEHTRNMLTLAALPSGARVLDMGAGKGSAVALMCSMGLEALGIDREPRGEQVQRGDFLHCPFESGSFDAVISQCSFFVSGDVPAALAEAARLLKKGGKLLLSDVHPRQQDLGNLAESAGFRVLHRDDMTRAWKQYYIEAIWSGTAKCMPTGQKYSYTMLICEKE